MARDSCGMIVDLACAECGEAYHEDSMHFARRVGDEGDQAPLCPDCAQCWECGAYGNTEEFVFDTSQETRPVRCDYCWRSALS